MGAKGLLKNPLFRLMFFNGLAGMLAAAVVTSGLLLTNVGNLGSLVVNSSNPVLPVVLLFAGLTITLVSVAIGVAVMRLPSDESGPRSGRRQRLAPTGLPQARKPAFATVRPKP